MKTVTGILYEKGDMVLIKSGYNKGMVGVVDYHDSLGEAVCYDIPELGDEAGEGNRYSETKYLSHISKEEAEKINSNRKFLKVNSLDATITVGKSKLQVGCQEITFSDANKIADFIKKNCVIKKKSLAKKKKTRK